MLSKIIAALTFASTAFGYLAPLEFKRELKYVEGEFMVMLKSTADLEGHFSWVESIIDKDSQVYKKYNINGEFKAYSGRFTERMLNKIRSEESVLLVEPNSYVELFGEQRNPPWGLDRVDQRNLPLDNRFIYSDKAGSGVDVYIIDTGIRLTHQDFKGKALWGTTTPRNTESTDLNGHGSHVAGTVCGQKYGLAKNATCIAVKVMRDSGLGTVFDITDGVAWVVDSHQASKTKKSIANMSLGSPISNPIIDASVGAAARAGVIMIVAAGNADRNACNGSPAGQPDMITVGASDETDARAYFSNWGPCVDVFAPGSNITSAWYDGDTAEFVASGTSMASPHTAGIAALILGDSPSTMTQEEMRASLVKYATSGVLRDIEEGSPNLLLYYNPLN